MSPFDVEKAWDKVYSTPKSLTIHPIRPCYATTPATESVYCWQVVFNHLLVVTILIVILAFNCHLCSKKIIPPRPRSPYNTLQHNVVQPNSYSFPVLGGDAWIIRHVCKPPIICTGGLESARSHILFRIWSYAKISRFNWFPSLAIMTPNIRPAKYNIWCCWWKRWVSHDTTAELMHMISIMMFSTCEESFIWMVAS